MDINLMRVCCVEYLHIHNKYTLTLTTKVHSLPIMMGFLSPATPVGPTWPGAELSAPPTELSSHPRSSTAPTGVSLLESHHQLWLAAQRCRENPAVSNASGSEPSTKKVLIQMKKNILALSKMCTLNISSFFLSAVSMM